MDHVTVRSRYLVGILWLVLANLLWAAQGIAVKMLDRGMHPIAIAVLPLCLVTLLLSPAIFWRRPDWRTSLGTAWVHRTPLFLTGVGGQLVAQIGMTLGIARTLASDGAILNSLVPIFSAIIATFLLRERLTLLRVGALLLGLSGVLLLSPIHWSQPLSLGMNRALGGNALIALGCFGSAFYNVYSKRLLNDFTEIEILFFSYLAASLASIPLLVALDPGCLRQFAFLTVREWGAFGFLAIFIYGVSMVLFLHALRRVDVIVASVSLYLVPILGAFFAMTFLKERIAPQGFLGFAAVLLGMVVILYRDFAP
ncbi:MAG: EamA/RhaT family transporter [Acidobacteriaceae bacterium]|nr:EamA/RhaT family transporter [Acidobacteriaceae bacterium]